MARALGFNGARALLARKVGNHLQKRADRMRDIAVQLHREAPRGGSNLNRWGQRRSAAGEAPAEEFGTLKQILDMPPSPLPDGGYSVPVNYAVQEYGTIHMGARPMGRMAVAILKQEVEGGS